MSEDVSIGFAECTIEWDDELDALVHRYEEPVEADRFRAIGEAILDVIAERNVEKFMTDVREMDAMPPGATEWVIQTFLPRAIESSLQCVAVVYPEAIGGKMDLDGLARQHGDAPLKRIFTDDPNEARAWLEIQ